MARFRPIKKEGYTYKSLKTKQKAGSLTNKEKAFWNYNKALEIKRSTQDPQSASKAPPLRFVP